MKMEKERGKFIDKAVDFIFSRDTRKYILIFVILGFIIRLLVSLRMPFYADEISYAAHSIGFIDSGKLQIMDQDAVWFFLTNLCTKILGINVLGIRFLSVLVGCLTIILIYLIGKELFNKQVGFLASIIITISSFHILIWMYQWHFLYF